MAAISRFRELLEGRDIVVAPGVYDGLSAKLVERAGFAAVYASGGAIARRTGVPDLGLLSAAEMTARIAEIAAATRLPVIADADTGYGNALNVQRTVQHYARAGAAALHLEDQLFPKRCGHYEDKALEPAETMVQKIRAAREAAEESGLVIIARTDAVAVEGLEAALARARRHGEAGADVLFVEAPRSLAEIERIAAALPQPKLINMFQGGKTPLVPVERLKALGCKIVIIPSELQRAAIRAIEETLAAIKTQGSSAAVAERLASFAAREALVGLGDYLALEKRFGG
ncbi:MAG: oxaloacetate decarboxylase [Alphaproteobacteria bacterium]